MRFIYVSMKLPDKPYAFLLTDVICEDTVPDNTNLTVSSYNLTYLSTIKYTCDMGHYFEFENRSTFRTSVCNTVEEWTITEEQICERKLCPHTATLLMLEFMILCDE